MKPIILTDDAKANALEIFKKLLDTAGAGSDLKINITPETLLQEQGIEKPTVFVTSAAYLKMITLINSSDKELAWYGTVTKVLHNYLIEDIFVYPQTVTAATVDADEEKCAKWFMELPDETINKLRFQGHSHVKMGASPSGRDTNNWQQFANLLKPNEFYLLCIGNQRGEFYWNIYDRSINVFFENKDITMIVIDDKGNSLKDWASEEIKKYIVNETPTYNKGYYANQSNAVQTTMINGTQYQLVDEKSTPKTDYKPRVVSKSKENSVYKEMIAYIPSDLRADVDYDVDSDIYYTYTWGLPGFEYSNLYDCSVCSGVKFRARHMKEPANKRGPDRPKKENKNK